MGRTSRWLKMKSFSNNHNFNEKFCLNTDGTNSTDNMSPAEMKEMAEMSLMDKYIKNTAVMADLFELLCCPSSM